jgi:hypothetical protein
VNLPFADPEVELPERGVLVARRCFRVEAFAAGASGAPAEIATCGNAKQDERKINLINFLITIANALYENYICVPG